MKRTAVLATLLVGPLPIFAVTVYDGSQNVAERYHDANPWYYPWSPNASGMGRILQMISEFEKHQQ
jgi:hypothetical protein